MENNKTIPKVWKVKFTEQNFKVLANWAGFDWFTSMDGREDWYLTHIKTHTRNPSHHEEISFLDFCLYVLNEVPVYKDGMKLVGFKLKDECSIYSSAVSSIIKGGDFNNRTVVFPSLPYAYLDKAGVLSIWFNPVYEDKPALYPFGDDVVFEINDGVCVAKVYNKDTEHHYGDVTLSELNTALYYINNPPKLAGYAFCIHQKDNGLNYSLNSLDKCGDVEIAFGCKSGKVSELIDIRNALQSAAEKVKKLNETM